MALILGMFVHYIPLSGTSSPYNLLYFSPGIYGLVQTTAGVGAVFIWDFCVAITRGGGGKDTQRSCFNKESKCRTDTGTGAQCSAWAGTGT